MGMIGFVSYRNTLALHQRAAEVEATYDIIDNLTNLYANMAVAESGRRDYIKIGGPSQLGRHRRAIALMNQLLTDILILMRAEFGNLICKLEPPDIESFGLNLVEDFQFLHKNNIPIKFVSEGSIIRPYLDEKLL
jgi:hypothetical protein